MCEQSNLSIAHVIYPRVQWHIISNYEGNRYKDAHQEITTWQRLYISMNKTKDKRNEVEAKSTKRTVAE